MNFNKNSSNRDILGFPTDESEHILLNSTMMTTTDEVGDNSSSSYQDISKQPPAARLSTATEPFSIKSGNFSFNSIRTQNQKDEDPWSLLQGTAALLPYNSQRDIDNVMLGEDTQKSAAEFPPKIDASTPSYSSNDDAYIRPYDIICGRNSLAFNNIGNRRFRVTISLNLQRYNRAKTKQERTLVIRSIIDVLRLEAGARFLKRKGDVFVELSERQVRQKVAHALRDSSCYSTAAASGGGGDNATTPASAGASVAKAPHQQHFAAATSMTTAGPGPSLSSLPLPSAFQRRHTQENQQNEQLRRALPQLRPWASSSEIISSSFSSPPNVATMDWSPTSLHRSDSFSSF